MKKIFAIMFTVLAMNSAQACHTDVSEEDISIMLSVLPEGKAPVEINLKDPCDGMGVLTNEEYEAVKSVAKKKE